mmetsp:Transcript_22201/g.40857  ORF Transcript_22201/g.40857 Transcript_22201/m.40857 type:complete len:393 (+) Transcript_22201:64-1242(+)
MRPLAIAFAIAWPVCCRLALSHALTQEPYASCQAGNREQCAAIGNLDEEGPVQNAQLVNTQLAVGEEPVTLEIKPVARGRLAILAVMFGTVLAWTVVICKFTCDGSLPARLAIWGFLPEAFAAISVRAVIALLRLKDGPLPVIYLRQCVDDDGALQLAEAIRKYRKKAELAVLEVPQNPNLTLRGLAELVAVMIEDESEICELDVSYNPQLGNECVTTLMPLLSMKSKVKTLKLADCGLQGQGLQALAIAAKKSKVAVLDLSYNSFGGATNALVAILESPTMLTELKLDCCELALAEIRVIATELPHTSIDTLSLAGNGLGSDELVALSEGLPGSLVRELHLENNDIDAGCPGLTALASAWVKRPFARVMLAGNNMSDDEVVEYIQTLRTLL